MNTRAKIGEVVLLLGMVLFVGGAVGYVTGQLPAEQISGIGALALIFIGAGAGMKRRRDLNEN
ncbi:MAG: hypothetical protein DIAAKJNI_00214 [Candidatus Argoarchaeum ethanivorans]|uniref:Uncharacterized protein n=1 Tax=Candidatus Argoarchaeum ethanivorans TaxID=2608793 RepID=A0A811T8C6_9EURY|nr:MAG: hypothetical protein DIAAKJNI_00201 [Candidatus Argoarchaeum ethanivorans]CAD6492088.1 MAG: hypothetical protein DIAAKJNI_00214 [Candidatus Argoarchaeum ethanivorans]